MLVYVTCGGCPLTWHGLSISAFNDLWQFFKLSASSGVMMCLESWYYKVLMLLTGNLDDVTIAVDALSICINISNWELMIPTGFFAGIGVRVANELGAGNGKNAKFATIVSVVTSLIIGFIFFLMILLFNDKIALLFTKSEQVLDNVQNLKFLLAFTILLNSIQPVLSGVAVGSGWQSTVAFVNIGSYYIIGVPFGVFLGLVFNFGIKGIWGGMLCGTFVQTLVLSYMTSKCDWDKEAREVSNHGEKQSLIEK
ncbi:MATE efflux family protein, expressed [Zostera marina]|uniref:MATE efflux family protein, expressed n=1 Tax=Zostera marina TaxID=29655 RepID=A0A0K9PYV5_ZOSMR|nr:MATE efflux family protein, expressed [Zostera marina]